VKKPEEISKITDFIPIGDDSFVDDAGMTNRWATRRRIQADQQRLIQQLRERQGLDDQQRLAEQFAQQLRHFAGEEQRRDLQATLTAEHIENVETPDENDNEDLRERIERNNPNLNFQWERGLTI
jgi:N-acetyl-beta-hexosaminidase